MEGLRVEACAGRPSHVHWKGQRLPVTGIADVWVVQGRWWDREERRRYFRILTRRLVLEVYEREGEWHFSRILD